MVALNVGAFRPLDDPVWLRELDDPVWLRERDATLAALAEVEEQPRRRGRTLANSGWAVNSIPESG